MLEQINFINKNNQLIKILAGVNRLELAPVSLI